MKLQNMAVIFLIIIIPIILLLSYYISLQVDTLNMQASYNTKLLESVKEAISSFEINTVEWNESYSETADSKRRDIKASINSFITSFANSMGVGGSSREYILPYVPALAYTLYDGYYIYSPSDTKETIKDKNGVAVFMSEKLIQGNNIKKYKYKKEDFGKVLYQYDDKKGGTSDGTYDEIPFTLNSNYAKGTYSHILKPFAYYSARYKNGSTDITVNYTLDNYITIYGNVNDNYVTKSGYLINTSNVSINANSFQGITVKKDNSTVGIDKETLTEKIAWKESEKAPYNVGIYTYVYASDNTKVYFDEINTPFQVNSSGIRVDLDGLTSVKYKKLVLLKDMSTGECTEVYQALTSSSDGKIRQGNWYSEINGTNKVTGNNLNTIGLKEDVSSINYYTEAYGFSKWVNVNLNSIMVDDMQGDKTGISITGNIFDSSQNPENESSIFAQHKREVIKKSIISSLNQAITSYSRNSEGTYRLPVLTETDWSQLLSNVSIIAFVQNIPIGLKTYNNYAIATSTLNKEYVDSDEIYLNVKDGSDNYYHLPYCNQIDASKEMIGYRSIDYIPKSYKEEENTKYYYKHDNISNEADYYCLVQNSLYQKSNDLNKTKAYQTALARERYVTHSFKK